MKKTSLVETLTSPIHPCPRLFLSLQIFVYCWTYTLFSKMSLPRAVKSVIYSHLSTSFALYFNTKVFCAGAHQEFNDVFSSRKCRRKNTHDPKLKKKKCFVIGSWTRKLWVHGNKCRARYPLCHGHILYEPLKNTPFISTTVLSAFLVKCGNASWSWHPPLVPWMHCF